jgi:hypothetical protein
LGLVLEELGLADVIAGQRELLSRLRAVVEAKDAENQVADLIQSAGPRALAFCRRREYRYRTQVPSHRFQVLPHWQGTTEPTSARSRIRNTVA